MPDVVVTDAEGNLVRVPEGFLAGGSGDAYDGVSASNRETMFWAAPVGLNEDQIINPSKTTADSRVADLVRNSPVIFGAMASQKDSIIGAALRLNAKPRWTFLQRTLDKRLDGVWAKEFQQEVEDRWSLMAESGANWLDYTGKNTFSDMARTALGLAYTSGECCIPVEWIRNDPTRPCKTAVHFVSSDRLSNPNEGPDTQTLRRGVQHDDTGAVSGYQLADRSPYANYAGQPSRNWQFIPAKKPWGRTQFIHIFDQRGPEQARGISDVVAALGQSRMLGIFQKTTLQNAIINASVAATVESELPTALIQAMLGQDATGGLGIGNGKQAVEMTYGPFLAGMNAYLKSSPNLKLNGANISHLFPGTKLNTKTLGTPGGVGTDFEQSFLRQIAVTLGVSYEELTHDLSQTNYSSLMAGIAKSRRFQAARKRIIVDTFANAVYELVLEEWWNADMLPLPNGMKFDSSLFYVPLAKEAFCKAEWIGTGMGQIDQVKETQGAMMRIAAGLSTYERECARLGYDWRDTFDQLQREQSDIGDRGLKLTLVSQSQGNNDVPEGGATPAKKDAGQQTPPDKQAGGSEEE